MLEVHVKNSNFDFLLSGIAKRRAVSEERSRMAYSSTHFTLLSPKANEDDITGKQLSTDDISTCGRSTTEIRSQTSPDSIASGFATGTIHLPEDPNPPRRSERLKRLKQLVDSSNAYAQGSGRPVGRSGSPVYPGKNHCNASGHAIGRSSVLMIEVDDSEDSMPLCGVQWQPKETIGSGNSIRSEHMLNDKLFCYYMEHIWNQFSETKRDSFTHMDSCWFHLYAEDKRKKAVLGWIKRQKIFSKKYVLVPIVIWSHWNLLIFCNFGESLESTRKAPCMLLLDSLQALDPLRLEPLIRRFVVDIFRKENRPEKKALICKIPLLIPKVPQQIDDKKCGYFVLYYINLFIKEAPEDFSIHEGYPYFMKEDWFTPEGLDNFCRSLDSIDLVDYD